MYKTRRFLMAQKKTTLGQSNIEWKMDPLKLYFLLNMRIFHCYVTLPEGTNYQAQLVIARGNLHQQRLSMLTFEVFSAVLRMRPTRTSTNP